MVLASEPADIGYIAYIDEAGDTGLRAVKPLDPNGSSEWFVMGAAVISVEREPEIVDWVQSIREQCDIRQRADLHFRNMAPWQKLVACEAIAALSLRCFAVVSNKKNMRGHTNPRVEAGRGTVNEWFYNHCTRLLLERITEFVERRSLAEHNKTKHLQIIFSERGNLRYSQTIAYLDIVKNQARSSTTLLDKRVVRWPVLNTNAITFVPHSKNAGVQLADVVASSFYCAADSSSPRRFDTRYAEALKDRMWSKGGAYADHGVAFQPMPPEKAKLTEDQKKIFRFYGFHF